MTFQAPLWPLPTNHDLKATRAKEFSPGSDNSPSLKGQVFRAHIRTRKLPVSSNEVEGAGQAGQLPVECPQTMTFGVREHLLASGASRRIDPLSEREQDLKLFERSLQKVVAERATAP
jgi:hypothetical protein